MCSVDGGWSFRSVYLIGRVSLLVKMMIFNHCVLYLIGLVIWSVSCRLKLTLREEKQGK